MAYRCCYYEPLILRGTMSSLTKRFAIFIKKENGFERINEQIIKGLESDGWVPDRNKDKNFVILRTNRNYHIFKSEKELKEYVVNTLGIFGKNKDVLSRIVIVIE
jgi:hypothetical protein